MAGGNDKRTWAWEREWRGNILSSSVHALDPETGARLTQGWAGFFAVLPEGARVVDTGTGNGLIPLIALEVSDRRKKNFDIHGADLAAIDPARAVPGQAALLREITFHGGTPTE